MPRMPSSHSSAASLLQLATKLCTSYANSHPVCTESPCALPFLARWMVKGFLVQFSGEHCRLKCAPARASRVLRARWGGFIGLGACLLASVAADLWWKRVGPGDRCRLPPPARLRDAFVTQPAAGRLD